VADAIRAVHSRDIVRLRLYGVFRPQLFEKIKKILIPDEVLEECHLNVQRVLGIQRFSPENMVDSVDRGCIAEVLQ